MLSNILKSRKLIVNNFHAAGRIKYLVTYKKEFSTTSELGSITDDAKNVDKVSKQNGKSNYVINTIKDLSVLSKFRLSSLVAFTTAIGFFCAGGPMDLTALGIVCTGTGLCAASASSFNQIFEVEQDMKMKRTSFRPLPSKKLTSEAATIFGVSTAILGTSVLFFGSNPVVAGLGLGNIILYAGPYTYSKRVSEINTYIGSVVGAIPPVMGYAAATGGILLAPPPIILSTILFLWQIPHFMALAWMYRQDYARAGFKMISCNDPSGERTSSLIREFIYYLTALPLLTSIFGYTSYMFLLEGILLNGYFYMTSYRFNKDRSNGNARSIFLFSLIYLPALLCGYVFFAKDEKLRITDTASSMPLNQNSGILATNDDNDDTTKEKEEGNTWKKGTIWFHVQLNKLNKLLTEYCVHEILVDHNLEKQQQHQQQSPQSLSTVTTSTLPILNSSISNNKSGTNSSSSGNTKNVGTAIDISNLLDSNNLIVPNIVKLPTSSVHSASEVSENLPHPKASVSETFKKIILSTPGVEKLTPDLCIKTSSHYVSDSKHSTTTTTTSNSNNSSSDSSSSSRKNNTVTTDNNHIHVSTSSSSSMGVKPVVTPSSSSLSLITTHDHRMLPPLKSPSIPPNSTTTHNSSGNSSDNSNSSSEKSPVTSVSTSSKSVDSTIEGVTIDSSTTTNHAIESTTEVASEVVEIITDQIHIKAVAEEDAADIIVHPPHESTVHNVELSDKISEIIHMTQMNEEIELEAHKQDSTVQDINTHSDVIDLNDGVGGVHDSNESSLHVPEPVHVSISPLNEDKSNNTDTTTTISSNDDEDKYIEMEERLDIVHSIQEIQEYEDDIAILEDALIQELQHEQEVLFEHQKEEVTHQIEEIEQKNEYMHEHELITNNAAADIEKIVFESHDNNHNNDQSSTIVHDENTNFIDENLLNDKSNNSIDISYDNHNKNSDDIILHNNLEDNNSKVYENISENTDISYSENIQALAASNHEDNTSENGNNSNDISDEIFYEP